MRTKASIPKNMSFAITLRRRMGRLRAMLVTVICPTGSIPSGFGFGWEVCPEFQDQGIGSALYGKILSDLVELSARWLHTAAWETWRKSREFLEKRGFQEVMRSWES